MQPMNVNDLVGNPGNPRVINNREFDSLKKSIEKYGDISGITWNRRLQRLVTGHQRVSAFKDLGWRENIEYTKTYETPTEKGTVALGYVVANGERYAYREVDWSAAIDSAANIAANTIQAKFDNDALAEMTYQIYQEDPTLLEFTGQSQKQINDLLQSVGMDIPGLEQKEDVAPADDKEDLSFRLTREQKDFILTAIENIRITKDIPSQDPQSMNGSALYYMAQHYMSTTAPVQPASDLPPELPQA